MPCHQSRRRPVACRRRGANAARCTSPRRGRAASNAKSLRRWPRASFAAAHVRCRTPSRRLCIRCRWPAPTGSSCDANRPALPRGQQHPGPRADYTRGAHHPCPHRSRPPVVCAASRHRKTVSISPRRSAPRLTVVAPTDDGGRPSLRASPDSPAADGARNAVLQVGVVAAPAVLRATSSPSPSPLQVQVQLQSEGRGLMAAGAPPCERRIRVGSRGREIPAKRPTQPSVGWRGAAACFRARGPVVDPARCAPLISRRWRPSGRGAIW